MKVKGLTLEEAAAAANKGMLMRHPAFIRSAVSVLGCFAWDQSSETVPVNELTLQPDWCAHQHKEDSTEGIAAREAALKDAIILAPTGWPHKIKDGEWYRLYSNHPCIGNLCGWFMPWKEGWHVIWLPGEERNQQRPCEGMPGLRIGTGTWQDRCETCAKWWGHGIGGTGCRTTSCGCCDQYVTWDPFTRGTPSWMGRPYHTFRLWPRCAPPELKCCRDTIFFKRPDGTPIHWTDCIGEVFRGFEGTYANGATWVNWFVPFQNMEDGQILVATAVRMATS